MTPLLPEADAELNWQLLMSELEDTTDPEYSVAKPPPDTPAIDPRMLLLVNVNDDPAMRSPLTNTPTEPPDIFAYDPLK